MSTKIIRHLIFISLLVFAFVKFAPLLGQTCPTRLLQWTEENELASNFVYNVIEDHTGMLWVATANGLCRFDGTDFQTFQYDPLDSNSIGGNEIIYLHESNNGKIWIGSDGGGLSIFDYRTEQFTQFSQNKLNSKTGMLGNRVNCIYEDASSNMWIGYRAIGSGLGGLTLMDSNLNISNHFLSSEKDYAGFPLKVTHIAQDPKKTNQYWLGGRSFFRWNKENNILEEFPCSGFSPNHESIGCIKIIENNKILVGTLFDGLWLFDKKEKKWLGKIHDVNVQSLKEDSNGILWVANDVGIGILNPQNWEINYILKKGSNNEKIPSNINWLSIQPLSNGNLWICTDQGLFCWNETLNQFPCHSINGKNNEEFIFPWYAGHLPKDQYLFASSNHLLITDTSFNLTKNIKAPTEERLLRVIKRKENIFFIIATTGMFEYKYPENNITEINYPKGDIDLTQTKPYSAYAEDTGDIWVGTRTDGLLRLDLKTNTFRQYLHTPNDTNSLCHNNYLFEIDEDQKGNLWICTDKGVSVLNPKTDNFIYIPGLKEKVGDHIVHRTEEDNHGNIWLGTRDNGLFRYNPKNHAWKHFTIKDGLPYNGVNRILYNNGKLWLATRKGLCKMDIETENITTYTANKGMWIESLYAAQLSALPDNTLLITDLRHSTFFNFFPKKIKPDAPAPKITLKSVRTINANPAKKYLANKLASLNLNADQNYFAIDYQGIDFSDGRNLKFRYMLEGYDQDWVDAGKQRTAIYSNLDGGEYSFMVSAANSDGIWSEAKSLNIRLKPPFHKTALFFLLCVCGIAGLTLSTYRFRLNQIKKEANFKQQLAETEMKALRSQINPHFIFNCLNSIKHYIIKNDTPAGTHYVGRFAALVRMILVHSKEKLIPLEKELEAIKLYVWLEQERLEHGFDATYDFDIKTDVNKLYVPPMLIQTYLENAIWHGLMPMEKKGKLILSVSENESYLSITIKDNGIGREASYKMRSTSNLGKTGMGLQLSERRLSQINKLYGIKSSVKITNLNPGTMVHIIFQKVKD